MTRMRAKSHNAVQTFSRIFGCVLLSFLLWNFNSSCAASNDFLYLDEGASVTLIGYTGPGGVLNIPDALSGKPITEIGDRAFFSNNVVTSVTIPSTVTNIGGSAFEACVNLTNITIPNTVKTIGIAAFARCVSLSGLLLPAGLDTIGDDAFAGCTRLANISLPNSLTDLSNYIFNSCSHLTEVIIPDSIISIGNYAFDGCTSLATVLIPHSVSSIGTAAFASCSALTNIAMPEGVENIGDGAFLDCASLISVFIPGAVVNIGGAAFDRCNRLREIVVSAQNPAYSSLDGALLDKSQTTLIRYPPSKNGSWAVPNTVARIEDEAFSGCGFLTSLAIPSGVASIGSGAFAECTALRAMSIPESVTSLNAFTFSGCGSLTNVQLPNGITKIGTFAFEDCTNLPAVILPDRLISIEDSALARCFSLVEITLPNSLTNLGNSAFSYCTALKTVHMGNGLRTIGALPFGSGAFSGCSSLTKIDFGQGLTDIGDHTFENCTSLTSLTIPNGIGRVGYFAFANCTGLKSVSLSRSIIVVETTSFFGCRNLQSFTVDPGNPVYSGENGILFHKYWHILLQYPVGRTGVCFVSSNVASIDENAFRDCGGLTAIIVDPVNTNYSSLEGVLFDKSQNLLIRYPGGKPGDYGVPGGVTTIGNSAFRGSVITKLSVSLSVTNVFECAFSGCTVLTAITVDPANPSYSSLDGVLFDKVQRTLIKYPGNRLGSCIVPGSVASINSCAFEDAVHLKNIFFLGTPPSLNYSPVFPYSDNPTVYYREKTSGWNSNFSGYPAVLWRAGDDLDNDGMANLDEMLAGTDPADARSELAFENTVRLNDLTASDQTPVGPEQYALYFQSVPERTYELQFAETVTAEWKTVAILNATTSQKRVVVSRPQRSGFYRLLTFSPDEAGDP
jgi:hypothetical protein